MLKVIEIDNIKGISNKRFELDISANKPSLLVAPNGFGKSSLATAFNSMNNTRIALHDDDLHSENPANLPKISIEYLQSGAMSLLNGCISGFWHHKHLKLHPWKNIVVRIPGPS